MARKLAGILIFIAMWLPIQGMALGLGNIELKSYLNQPLNARIPILSARHVRQLQVRLASPREHASAGVDYTYVMSQLRIRVERKNGAAWVVITTHKPFREPYLSILLELSWANGRLMREYTVLVDPPGIVKSSGPAVVSQAPVNVPARPSVSRKQPAAPADERYPRIPIDDDKPAARTTGGTYGPIGRNETLWTIARKTRPDQGISVEQMMIALQRKNPHAFIGNNINRLRRGAVLTIPARDVITALNRRQAIAEVRRQYQVWKQARSGTAAKPPVVPAPTTKTGGGRLKVTAPRIGTASGTGGSAGGKGDGTGATSAELAKAREAARASEREKAVLAERVKALEAQLANMKKLAKLRNDQLAALQAKLAELQSRKPAAKPEAAKPSATAKPEVPAKPETGPVQPDKPEKPAVASTEQPKPVKKTYKYVPARVAPAGTPINQNKVSGYKPVDLKSLPSAPVPADPFVRPKVAAKPDVGKPADASLLDRLRSYYEQNRTMTLIVGGGALVLLVLLVLLIIRRRNAAAGFQESILTEPTSAAAATVAAAMGTTTTMADNKSSPDQTVASKAPEPEPEPQPEVEQAASSYLSDFTVSGMDALDSDVSESDPLTEADVFLAYGRFEPAEAMIREAIAAEPERNDLKMKLLEIHYQAKNVEGFERDAEAFREALSAEGDDWRHAVEMGRELNPSSPLFSEAADEATTSMGETGDDEFTFSEFEVPEAEAPPAEELEAELKDLAAEEQKDSAQKEDVLEFDLGVSDDSAASESPAGDLEFDLNEIEASVEKTPEEDKLAGELAEELSEIAETIDTGTAAGQTDDAGQVEEAGEAELDEVGTKLDLARAYIDMGDPEGARSILEEVLDEGNDSQKQEAEELMGRI